MKYIVHLNDIEMIEPLIERQIAGVIVGTDHYSNGGIINSSIEQIRQIVAKINHRMHVYVLVNRLFHQHEIASLKVFLKDLMESDIDGVVFQDFGVLNIVQELQASYKMIYAPDTLNTNHQTMNSLSLLGVDAFMLAGQLHYDEVEAIVNHSQKPCIVPVHGVQYISCSRRELLTNYFSQINKSESSRYQDKIKIKVNNKEEYSYIYEDEAGTHIYTTNELCTLNLKIPGEYGYIETLYLDNDYILDVIDYYQNHFLEEELKTKYPEHNYDHGFLEDGTVYKIEDVRKREEHEKR
ncbi:peptidase U32 family protein [Beduini massiliensis]|uniref:peptidase U32 family protein n=1 Tax=Beduini massiliensis TaxID=1585974 RepID=UPI00059A8DB0|nr:U32 family peptidase [Beduini massiliensis]